VINILVADDHSIVRAGLKQYVSDSNDMTVLGEACNGKETIKMALNDEYDVVVLDISMPDISGLDILKQLKIQKPNLKILVLTMHPEEQYAMRVLKAGASGYLTKESAPQELISAIRKVASGGRYVSPSLAEKLATYFEENKGKPLYQNLSDREYQVMCMIAGGKRLSDIAQELNLSIKTVSSYRTRILQKLKFKSNAELIRYAVDNKMVY
jgi:two-component system, NarL family, invasion response regulator UvrY